MFELLCMSIEDNSRNFIMNFVIGIVAERRKEKATLKRSRLTRFYSLGSLTLLFFSVIIGPSLRALFSRREGRKVE